MNQQMVALRLDVAGRSPHDFAEESVGGHLLRRLTQNQPDQHRPAFCQIERLGVGHVLEITRGLKNTLARRMFSEHGMTLPQDYLVKSTAVSFAFTDPASTAKALTEATKGIEFIKVKGGFMAGQALNSAQVKALADMPPLPVVRAQLLGVLQAPAGKLVRTIAEPARGLAAVIKAFTEKAPVAA